MGIYENIKLALEGLRLNKMRAFLTMLGIIIGIASVIAILTIGRAISLTVEEGFDEFASGLFVLYSEPADGDYDSYYQNDWRSLQIKEETLEMIMDKFGSRIETVVKEDPSTNADILSQEKNDSINVTPVNAGYIKAYKKEIILGRFIDDEDDSGNRKVIVLPKSTAEDLYGSINHSILGEEISLEFYEGIEDFVIIGVYNDDDSKLASMGLSFSSSNSYIPYNVGRRITNPYFEEGYDRLEMVAADLNDASALSMEIAEFVDNIQFQYLDNVRASAMTLESQIGSFQSMMTGIQAGIGGIAAISLIVGGIGVMNILLVSVVERTREIGIRKAIGAKQKDIRTQFLIEAIIICVVGGIIGIIFGGILGYIITSIMTIPTMPGLGSIVISVGFSMAIGIFFGYYPANQGAKLDPIEALRYE